jgi:hypothetical protein
MHARIVEGHDGWRYFSAGGPVGMGDHANATEARVVAVRGEEVRNIPISDEQETYTIFRMLYDESKKKLWVMSINIGSKVLIDRIDVETLAIDFSTTIDAYLGFDFFINKNNILITTFRMENGTDLTILDTDSGEVVKEISFPFEDNKLNALSMIDSGRGIFVSTTGGLFVLNTDTYVIEEFIPNNPGGQFTYFSKSGDTIYAIDRYDRVVEFSVFKPLHTRVIYEAEGKGLTSLLVL